MRILQLIDSLDAGGAERMAVNYANALSSRIPFSALIATRKEGVLKILISDKVTFEYLSKRSGYDLSALFKLRTFCSKNRITHIHAHSSSFFWAVLIKLTIPRIKIIWHDHMGSRENASQKFNKTLIRFSRFFSVVITVNESLNAWAEQNLKVKETKYLPNFTTFSTEKQTTFLKGQDSQRIIILANLKKPKNHLFFLKAFHQLKLDEKNWSLHIVGKDFNDEYSNDLKKYINANKVTNVYFYGQVLDVQFALKQADIGVLASTSEGFPMTILEYAVAELILFSTRVGQCSEIIKERKFLFNPLDLNDCMSKLYLLTNEFENKDSELKAHIKKINNHISEKYSETAIMKEYLKLLK